MPDRRTLHLHELVGEVLDAMGRYDADALHPLVAPDVVWWAPPSAAARGVPRPLTGRDAVVPFLTGGLGYFRAGTITWDVHQLVAEGDVAAVAFTRRSLTAAGTPYENEYCLVLRFDGDQIAEAWEHADTAHAFAQIDRPEDTCTPRTPEDRGGSVGT